MQLRVDNFKRYAALGCPRLPHPSWFEKKVITNPIAIAILADLADGTACYDFESKIYVKGMLLSENHVRIQNLRSQNGV